MPDAIHNLNEWKIESMITKWELKQKENVTKNEKKTTLTESNFSVVEYPKYE